MSKPAVSVIIPVYNTEKYLRRCLESVCNQTLRELEVICVNDASTDASAAILAEFAAHDSRVKVITFEQNRGVSSARNAGIEEASGEYIGFVDSDDKIDLDFYETLYAQAKASGVDVVKGKVQDVDRDGQMTVCYDNEVIRKNGTKFAFVINLVSAICRKSVVKNNGLCFLEGCIHSEDVLFLNEFILHSNGLSLIDDVSYYYCKRENSANSFILSSQKINSAVEAHRRIIDNTLSVRDAIGDEGTKYICLWCFKDFLYLSHPCHLRDNDVLRYCVETLFDLYEKVARWSSEDNSMPFLAVLPYLKAGDREGLYEFMLKNGTERKMIFAYLRYSQGKNKR